jgi:3D (Asp-Asp-Asp) domain-containing protein
MEHQRDDGDRKQAKDTEAEAATATEGRSLGNFLLTHYTFALESDPVNAHSPKVHAPGLPHDKKYRQSFLGTDHGVGMQGTGLAEDGHYIKWAGNGQYAYGVGGAAGPPEAWKTVAVDPKVIPLGSHLEIETYKGKGIFEARDTGGSIDGHHIDVFAGAIPIKQAYALGTKHSEVRLVKKSAGHGDQGKHDTRPKHPHGDGPAHHDGPAHESPTAHHKPKHDGDHQAHPTHEAPALAHARSGSAFIRRGSQGAAVKQIQEWVHVEADGIFGPITEAAVREFQRRHGLDVDGVVGPQTMHAFDKLHRPEGDDHEPGHDDHDDHDDHGDHDDDHKKPAPAHGKPDHDKPDHATRPPRKHHKPASGSDPVAVARRFVKHPPLRADSNYLKTKLPNYIAAGGRTNDCADFVSSVLKTAGKISFHDVNVESMKGHLLSHGWHTVPKHQAQPGDVWLCLSGGIQHVTLVSQSGGSRVIGANGSGTEFVTEESIHYPGEIWLQKR